MDEVAVRPSMRPLVELPASERRRIQVVLTDIDDTLTTDGLLSATAYAGLERLQGAGIAVIPVTGRPAGWCDLIARCWPVDGVVGENGALYFRYRRRERRMLRRYARSAAERADDRERLQRVRDAVLASVPEARVAADQPFREADLAIDFAEDVPELPERALARIVGIFHAHGAVAKISSIHVNGWFGDHDKLTMTARLLREQFALNIDHAEDNARVLFVGDSPNDEPMFAAFRHAVGVANFSRYAHRVDHRPRWLTAGAGGLGFAELVEALLSVRRPWD